MQRLALNQLTSSAIDIYHAYYSAFNSSRPNPGPREKAFKDFIKPFEAPQRSARIKNFS